MSENPGSRAPARRRRLPPFFALRALEAASRHRSYSRAADELSVTHGAVSHQIRRLEAELGARLFERRGNTMEPTLEALRLAAEVGRALQTLHEGVDRFGAAAEDDPLVISVEPLLARRWLANRLPGLLAHPAGARLEIRVEPQYAELGRDGVDAALRFGLGGWPGLEQRRLFGVPRFPVCSPAFAAAHGIRRLGDLLRIPLLHRNNYPWGGWFEALGLSPPATSGPVFDDTLMMLEAAAQGLGAALAPAGLEHPELASGRLVRPLDVMGPADRSYFMVWRPEGRKLKRIEALAAWLMDEIAGPRTAAAA
jgi:LysR family glycine cleavage system transcriptional activator